MAKSKKRSIVAVSVVLILISLALLYPSCRQYYMTWRQNILYQAQYQAVMERNDAIQQQVDALSSDQGVEDQVRSDLGWTKQGEVSVSVSGVDGRDLHGSLPEEIDVENVEFPATWYTRILDAVFFID